MSMEQSRTYRVMSGDEWCLLFVFTYIRAIYLHAKSDSESSAGGWLAVIIAVVLGAIPIINIGVLGWGLYAMHSVFGCKTSLTVIGVWAAIAAVFYGVIFIGAA